MNRYLRYTLLTLMWGGVITYVIYAATTSRRSISAKKVERVEINIADSSSQGHLVSTRQVRQWIARSDIRTIGAPIKTVDLAGLEKMVAHNGFVEQVVAQVDYTGTLGIAIRQRKPLLRLLTDGMNAYVTEMGYVFAAPQASSLYVPVITGSYKPPFPASYTGDIRKYIDAEKLKVDERIAALEREKYPLFQREIKNDRNISALRRMRVKRRWWRLESAESYDKRIVELRKEKLRLRRTYRYEAKRIQHELDRLGQRQEAERLTQKKLEKNYEDFMKLLTFVSDVENDSFWRSEVVQIAAYTASSGALEIELTPRSGRYTVLFGRIEESDEKFDKLLRFYRSGLSAIGWSEYKIIDIRYKDQVVCK